VRVRETPQDTVTLTVRLRTTIKVAKDERGNEQINRCEEGRACIDGFLEDVRHVSLIFGSKEPCNR
jgi:hypothetical protein